MCIVETLITVIKIAGIGIEINLLVKKLIIFMTVVALIIRKYNLSLNILCIWFKLFSFPCSKATAKSSKSRHIERSKSWDQQYLDVMKAVSSSCVVRKEDWWTYEICFGKFARQAHYNNEQVIMPDGQVMAKPVSLYTLQLIINQKKSLK